ncbi:MAG: IPT/TIG domain-containing protein [Candidatus Nomurabacteria bacterium]|jgi:hypothetical protein|nr:IPT/TIG domain-containing protein [Candidatus Nomurabacteria bacterium]
MVFSPVANVVMGELAYADINPSNIIISSTFGPTSGGDTLTFTSPEFQFNPINYTYNGTNGADGSPQTFIAPTDGDYQIELWGAQGNNATNGAKGGYTKGTISLNAGDTLYFHVGAQGVGAVGGYNGGASGGLSGGGGATDVRLENGAWNDEIGLNSRIMVAAGGGGYGQYSNIVRNFGYGGGLTGGTGTGNENGRGATQTSGGSGGTAYGGAGAGSAGTFGIGGAGITNASVGGGGGGYYGGGGGSNSACCWGGGGGGSSYVSGLVGSVAIAGQSDRSPRQDSSDNLCANGTTDPVCSEHYSGKVFSDTLIVAGNAEMPTPSGGTETGHAGNGYARITNADLIGTTTLDNVTIDGTPCSDIAIISVQTFQCKTPAHTTGAVDIEITIDDDVITLPDAYTYWDYSPKNVSTLLSATITFSGGSLGGLSSNDIVVTFGTETGENITIVDDTTFTVDIPTSLSSGDWDVILSINNKAKTLGTIGTFGNTSLSRQFGPATGGVASDFSGMKEYSFPYTGSTSTFTAPINANYTFQLWGAQGNNATNGAKGGYTRGVIGLNANEVVYINVGGQGVGKTGGYNGGASGGLSGGGGATDVRLENGAWDSETGLNSRIMVAAGGGGYGQYLSYIRQSGYGGGLTGGGVSGSDGGGGGATQTSGGAGAGAYGGAVAATAGTFGVGGAGVTNINTGNGGGGYYGGGGGGNSGCCFGGGGGGSSYVSGLIGSVAIAGQSDRSPRRDSSDNLCANGTTDPLCSEHYSGKVFSGAQTIAGNSSMPSPTDNSTQITGNSGDGYATVSLLASVFIDGELCPLTANLTACTPAAHPAGSVDVQNNNFSNNELVTVGTYTYVDFAPKTGSFLGGETVTFTGGNFSNLTPADIEVKFDDLPATNITIVNDTTFTVTTPAHAAATVDVYVSIAGDAWTVEDGYEYTSTFITLSLSFNQINLSGTPNQLLSGYLTANVKTNNAGGYHLDIAAGDSGVDLVCTISDEKYYIEALEEVGLMLNNHWGYAVGDTDSTPNNWQGITVFPTPIKTSDSSTDLSQGEDTVVWFGAKATYDLPACEYTGEVVISLTPEV